MIFSRSPSVAGQASRQLPWFAPHSMLRGAADDRRRSLPVIMISDVDEIHDRLSITKKPVNANRP
jgi:hypothetical protein